MKRTVNIAGILHSTRKPRVLIGALILGVVPWCSHPAKAAVSLGTSATLTIDFDNLAPTSDSAAFPIVPAGLQTAIPGGTGFEGVKVGGTSTTAMAYLVETGSQPGGAIYNFGANTAGTGDRALGMVASGTNVAAFGIQIINNSGSLLTGYTLTFDQEQYRSANGLTGGPNTDMFAYGTTAGNVGATATNYLTSSALTNNPSGDLVSTYSQTVSTTLIVTPRSVTVMNLNVPVGDSFFLRWTDVNDVANDAGLAVDNFTFTATATSVPEPSTWSTVVLFLGLAGWSQRKRLMGKSLEA